jgi:hypothetical protein
MVKTELIIVFSFDTVFSSVTEPKLDHFGGAGAVMRCDSGSGSDVFGSAGSGSKAAVQHTIDRYIDKKNIIKCKHFI